MTRLEGIRNIARTKWRQAVVLRSDNFTVTLTGQAIFTVGGIEKMKRSKNQDEDEYAEGKLMCGPRFVRNDSAEFVQTGVHLLPRSAAGGAG